MQVSGTASRREPAFNVPVAVLVWVGLLVALHAGRELLSASGDTRLLLEAAFVPAPWSIALGWGDADLAWPAHIGGLLVGAALFPLLTPRVVVRP